jgi:hypothetical protein
MRKRSAYKPRGVNPLAHLMAMQGARLLSADDALIRAERVRLAVDDIAKGKGTVAKWREVFDAVNMAEAWMRNRVAKGLEVVEATQVLVESILDRQRDSGSLALHSHELQSLRDFAADYCGLLQGVTHQEYFLAQKQVEDRCRRILSGERIPAGRVITGDHLEVA